MREYTEYVDTGEYKAEVVSHFKTIIDGKEVTRRRVLLRPVVVAKTRVIVEKKKKEQKKVTFVPLSFD